MMSQTLKTMLLCAAVLTTLVADAETRSLQPFQEELLQTAFNAASALPVQPHIKTRSRTQEAVAIACLELGQPEQALAYIDPIGNWRRGAGYANVALFYAERNQPELAEKYLALATELAEAVEDWRRDRILIKVAQAKIWLGQSEQANQLEEAVVESEQGKIAKAKAEKYDAENFDEQIEALKVHIETGHLDTVRNALRSATALYGQFYHDSDRRDFVERLIRDSWDPLPIFLRIDVLLELATVSHSRGDNAIALSFVDDAQAMFEGAHWPSRYKVSLLGRLAGHRAHAGDIDGARQQASQAMSAFEEEREYIVDIYRAEALHPVAEAYVKMGDNEAALAVYWRAVEEGMENPNSRPRAVDVSTTCVSMAVNSVEPDAELMDRIHQIVAGLGHPW